MIDATQLGSRLRSARERRALSQQAVADALGVQRTAITNIETGNRSVSTLELARLALIYGRKPADFFDSEVSGAPIVRLRSVYQGKFSADHEAAIEHVQALCCEGATLRRILEPEFTESLPDYGRPLRSSSEAIEHGAEIAREERRRLGLGSAPVGDVAAMISNQGVWVAAHALPNDLSGLFMSSAKMGMVVLINGTHASVRRRFSYAHEYAHVLCDRADDVRVSQGGDDFVEKRANSFASAFLMPEEGIKEQLRRLDKGQSSRQEETIYDVAFDTWETCVIRPPVGSQIITYQDVAIIARYFGVSYEAVVWRLKNLGHVSGQDAKRLISQSDQGRRFIALLKFQGVLAGGASDSNEYNGEDEQELRNQIIWLALEAFRREEISQGLLRELARKLMIPVEDLLGFAEPMS